MSTHNQPTIGGINTAAGMRRRVMTPPAEGLTRTAVIPYSALVPNNPTDAARKVTADCIGMDEYVPMTFRA